MTKNAQYDRALTLLAAGLSTFAVADLTGIKLLHLNRWIETRGFDNRMYAAVCAHHALLETTKDTARRARGALPLPLVLCPEFDEEDELPV